ncbi:hypothetical protein Goarm_022907 [Gossypium armourianum]|uniref:Uncharacterized protein n=1 Tax=Gossypium armourianum TaxID=34283 RepID=A0A7J9KHJ8_9ROSI|nr:hypothetical protein [Gossypium armourianum]
MYQTSRLESIFLNYQFVPPCWSGDEAKVKKTDEPRQWECRLCDHVRYNTRLLEPMKIGMDMFIRSYGGQSIECPERSSDSFEGNEDATEQQEEEDEEIDDEATKDDDFAPYQGNFESAFTSARKPRGD